MGGHDPRYQMHWNEPTMYSKGKERGWRWDTIGEITRTGMNLLCILMNRNGGARSEISDALE